MTTQSQLLTPKSTLICKSGLPKTQAVFLMLLLCFNIFSCTEVSNYLLNSTKAVAVSPHKSNNVREVFLSPVVYTPTPRSKRFERVKILNDTKKRWQITNARRGCSCLACEIISNTVEPGKFCEAQLTLSYFGSPVVRNVELWLELDDGDSIPVRLVSPEYPEIQYSPDETYFPPIPLNQSKSMVLNVATFSIDTAPATIVDIDPTNSALTSFAVGESTTDQVYPRVFRRKTQVAVRVLGNGELMESSGTLRFILSNQVNRYPLGHPVHWSVRGSYSITPPRLFVTSNDSFPKTVEVEIEGAGDTPFRLRSAVASIPELVASIDTERVSRRHVFRVAISKAFVSEFRQAEIQLATDNPTIPSVRVPVTSYVLD